MATTDTQQTAQFAAEAAVSAAEAKQYLIEVQQGYQDISATTQEAINAATAAEASKVAAETAEQNSSASAAASSESATAAAGSAAQAEEYKNDASDYARNKFTFYKTASDPDGTIAGLAATTDGQSFWVAQGPDALSAAWQYQNNAGVAVLQAKQPGTAAITGTIREFPTLAAAQADADAGNIPVGSTAYYRSADDSALAIEVINNGGTLAATGRAMPSMSALKTGYITGDAKSDAEIVTGLVIYADGSTGSSPSWNAWYLKVRAGETVTYSGTVGSNTAGEQMAYLIQLDANKAFVASLAEWTSTGSVTDKTTLSAVAIQGGYMYVRVRTTADFTLTQRKKTILVESDIDVSGGVASYASYVNVLANHPLVDVTSADSTLYVVSRVMYADGTISDAAGTSWKAAYVPVKAGDVVQYAGQLGSNTSGEVIAYIIQLDAAMKFVAPLASYTSPGTTKTGVISGAATQDGFVYVRVRVTTPAAVISRTKDRFMPGADVFGIKTDANLVSANRATTDVTSAATTIYITGRVMSADGSVVDNAGTSWKAAFLPVKAGEIIQYHGEIGSGTSGQVLAYIIQLDSAMKFVAPLATYTSPGSSSTGVMTGVATQDGFVYVRVRVTTPAATITKTAQDKALASDLKGSLKTVDYTSDASVIVDNSVMYSGGSVVSGSSYATWRMYYIPVRKGDVVEMYGQYGSATVGQLIAYIMQCDSDKGWVSDLYTFTSTGGYISATRRGVATRDGYVAVRVRKTTDPVYSVIRQYPNSAARVDDVSGMIAQAAYSNQVKAKVFNAPYHVDLSGLPEKNPSFSSFSNPLGYTFTKQWARRDFYNAADSFMLSFMDLSNDPWNLQSNIYDITAGNVFSYSWSAGKVSFRTPTANGRVVMFADRYLPFATSEIAIDRLGGNATMGIMFADVSQQNSVSVRVSNSLVICEIYAAGSLLDTTTFTGSDMTGAVLQVQNTGVSLLLKKVNADGTWKWIGRYEHYAIFDARKLEYLDTWKTYVFAQTDAFTALDSATFSGFSNRLSSGANSVSIRFLTYEDGTFIQRGNWLYFLVEGTGTTISDLYTQIVRINFNSGEVQMIGAIFQVRTDGTDEDVVLGDDSIKAVYDRNSQSWKGISCGMDYQGKGLADNNRPKLYFETKQDLLQGGVIIVRNSVQLKNANGSFFGIGASYVEDIDFYYEASSSQWVMTGNTISSGCKTFRSPTLYDGIVQEFVTAEVPAGVRDTGNQFVHFGETVYLTSGGTANRMHLRKYEAGLTFLGEFVQDVYLAPNTTGPWCTLVPFTNGDETELFMLSFDRSDLYEGLGNGASTYDHGGLYCWKASL
nr:MAG TPA: tail spike [Bacteriophage sp.]